MYHQSCRERIGPADLAGPAGSPERALHPKAAYPKNGIDFLPENQMSEQGSRARATRLLLVDDSPDLRKVLCQILRQEGFEVVTAVDGADALQLLQQDDGYDAVVLDHEMPGLKGLELLSVLRSQGRRVPVVLCSGSLELTPEECFRFGVGPVVPKPCEAWRLVEAIHEAIQKQE